MSPFLRKVSCWYVEKDEAETEELDYDNCEISSSLSEQSFIWLWSHKDIFIFFILGNLADCLIWINSLFLRITGSWNFVIFNTIALISTFVTIWVILCLFSKFVLILFVEQRLFGRLLCNLRFSLLSYLDRRDERWAGKARLIQLLLSSLELLWISCF